MKLKKTVTLAKSFNASVRVCESSVSRAAHTQKHMASQSVTASYRPYPPPRTPPHLTTPHSTKQVLSPEQPNVNPLLRTALPFPGSPQKRLPGQQSRLRGFIKSSFASLYCPTEGPCKHSVGLPQLLIHDYLSPLYHRLSEV